ncbi:MAG TPA: hypothetical protein VF753_22495 [Terriglobales bacterium]
MKKCLLCVVLFSVLILSSVAQTKPPLMGLHTNHLTSWPVQVPFDAWRSMDATGYVGGETRSMNWSEIQTGRETFHFDLVDAFMEAAAAAKVKVMFTPYGTPSFIASSVGYTTDDSGTRNCTCDAGTGVNGCYPPSDLNGDGSGSNTTWKNFIAALANHVHTKHLADPNGYADITFWESGNEYVVNGPQWCGSYKQLDRMMQDERCIIRGRGPGCKKTAINSQAQILTVALDDGGNPLDIQYLNATANVNPVNSPAQLADFINYHGYVAGSLPPENVVGQYASDYREIAQVPAAANKKIYITEGGWKEAKPPANWSDTASWFPRYLLSMASTGIHGFNFFFYDGYAHDTKTGPTMPVLWAASNPPDNYWCSLQASPGYYCSTGPGWMKIYTWLQGVLFSGSCVQTPAGSNIYNCAHTSSQYAHGLFVWYGVMNGSTEYTIPAGYDRMENMGGKTTPVNEGQKITLTDSPILLSSAE